MTFHHQVLGSIGNILEGEGDKTPEIVDEEEGEHEDAIRNRDHPYSDGQEAPVDGSSDGSFDGSFDGIPVNFESISSSPFSRASSLHYSEREAAFYVADAYGKKIHRYRYAKIIQYTVYFFKKMLEYACRYAAKPELRTKEEEPPNHFVGPEVTVRHSIDVEEEEEVPKKRSEDGSYRVNLKIAMREFPSYSTF